MPPRGREPVVVAGPWPGSPASPDDVDQLVEALRRTPGAIPAVQRAYDLERRHERVTHNPGKLDCQCAGCWLGADDVDLGLDGHMLHRLRIRGLFPGGYQSNRKRRYRLVESGWPPERRAARLELVREALRQAHERPQPRSEGPEGPPPLPDDLFSGVVGLDDVKKTLRLVLTSPEPQSALLYGPPATAKSILVEDVLRLPGVHFFAGPVSVAGLRQVLLDDRPWLVVFDEIDKLARTDQGSATLDALLTVLESGIVTKDVHDEHRSAQLAVRMLGTANSTRPLSEALLSRCWPIRLKEYTPEEMLRVTAWFLEHRHGVPRQHAQIIAAMTAAFSSDVRTARSIARMYQGDLEQAKVLAFQRRDTLAADRAEAEAPAPRRRRRS